MARLYSHLCRGWVDSDWRSTSFQNWNKTDPIQRLAQIGNTCSTINWVCSTDKRIYCTTFEYESDFDDRGIIHYIATNGGTEKWQNPHVTGRVVISASSIEVGSVADLVSKTPTELWTKDVPGIETHTSCWPNFSFVVHDRFWNISHCCSNTLHITAWRELSPRQSTHMGSSSNSHRKMFLEIPQGSVDGKNWVMLRRHTQDTTLNDKWATHTWEIGPGPWRTNEGSFRYFRILQTGRYIWKKLQS